FGNAGVNTKSYDCFFSSNLDGLNVNQDITLGTGFAGGGFKANLGLASEVFPGMHLGMTVDNILGFISWGAVTEDLHYNVRIDSVYVSNLEDDLYVESHETNDSGNWKTKLPIEIKMSALYQLPRANISLDWVQGTDNSLFTSKISRWSMGSELELTKNIPIHLGVAFGNSESPWRMSYGIGLKTKISEFGIGFQTYESMFPGLGSKGVSLATYMNLRM
ncbi:MAG: hypothetical protein PHI68_02440, partial [Candidatus Cloacimonetes bacterium]|nr:hypothetical protein [Candidatus Cloacimonadota bacterium]